MEIAGELRGNHTIHYSGMLPIAINRSWNAPITSVHSYWSGEDLGSRFFWDAMCCHIPYEYRPQLHHCASLKTCMKGIHLTQDRN